MSENTNKDHLNMAELAASLKMAASRPDVLETLTPIVRKRVEALQELQGQHDEIEAKFFEERAALEAKYQKLYEPFYSKRYEIVNGVVEVEGVTNETTKEQGEEKAAEEKGVPNFWLTALKTHEVLEEVITESDEGALKYLKDIRWTRVDDPKGFKLEFFFDANPYFKNEVLTKIYHMIEEDEPILEKAIGTEIEWYPGKCLTQKILKKKPKKGSKNTKPITKTENCASFFNFFKPPEVPEDDDDELDEDTAEELQELMEQDYEIGSAIRDKIIPHAVSWFTGEAAQEDGFVVGDDEDEEEDDEDEDDDDEDEEDEDEDDDDDDEPKNIMKKKGGRAPRPGQDQAGERPPECKQQ